MVPNPPGDAAMTGPSKPRAFTLIELLIVVAIIAILAAVAVPNFLEAQMRAKVTRVKSDFRTILVAMQAYRTDHTDYPPDDRGTNWDNDWLPLIHLTTPVAYITSIPTNPFFDKNFKGSSTRRGNFSYWRDYGGDWGYDEDSVGIYWSITSVGPDHVMSMNPRAKDIFNRTPAFLDNLYNATNGTISSGDLHLCNQGVSE